MRFSGSSLSRPKATWAFKKSVVGLGCAFHLCNEELSWPQCSPCQEGVPSSTFLFQVTVEER